MARGIVSRIVESCWGLYREKYSDKNTLHYVSNSTSDTQEVRLHKPITEQTVHISTLHNCIHIFVSQTH